MDDRQARNPRVALIHYTAPPVVGGVEAVLAEHARLFIAAGYPTYIVVGRGGAAGLPKGASIRIIPEIDSEPPANQALMAQLLASPPAEFGGGELPSGFWALSGKIETALAQALESVDVVIAHNVMTMHFNLALTAALHRLKDKGVVRHLVVWCHDVSRYVNPTSGAPQRFGPPWDLLRTFRPDFRYVAVSPQRQRLLADILGCPRERIRVIPNGVDPAALLGLSDVGRHLADAFGLLSADLVLLMPVRITRAKNVEYALRVTAALKAAGVRPRLVVTGPPDPHARDIEAYCDELRGLRRALDLEEEAIFIYEGTSRLPRPLLLDPSHVAELYRICDLVLMPSHREGFGMPVLEAGLVDKPIFATWMPVMEGLDEGMYHRIAPDEPPEHVAARILEWAEQDPSHRLRRRVRQAYTWSTVFARLIEPLLAELMATSAEGAA
ncbi:glycosyltransferase family 4 protein [Thermoflexus sp.]|uniref:glycosyltransferase family 4 protein n=1 Tax=Thermoflexus sp. TaxID=1969742 RepID=UPI0035E420FF